MNAKFLFLVLAFVLGGGFMIVRATQTGAAPVMMPSELIAQDGAAVSKVRVAGRVSESSKIVYEIAPRARLTFSVEDPKHPERGFIPVVYEGVRPDMFAIGRDVIIDGSFNGETLEAASLLTQCPSKYEAPDPEKGYTKPNTAPGASYSSSMTETELNKAAPASMNSGS